MRPLTASSAIFILMLSAMAPPLNAANLPTTPGSLVEDGVNFERSAQSTMRWKSIVKVYDIALYKAAGQNDTAMLADVPTRLEIRYHRAFPASEIVKGGDAILRRNVEPRTMSSLSSRLEELNRAYVDVKKGDSYSLTYVPGRGTSLRLNGRLLATIPGFDFASAYFGIWLGDKPISEKDRDILLGQ